jgi:ATP-binding cassette subfamily C protein CydC
MKRDLLTILALFRRAAGRPLLLGLLVAGVTVLAGVTLLGLSGWFITATGIAGLAAGAALGFDVFRPGAGVRGLAILRTGARYGERLLTHDATLSVVAALRVKLFRALARPGLARALVLRPGRLLFRLTGDLDALDALYLRLAVPLASLLLLALATGTGLYLLIGWSGIGFGLYLLVLGLALLGLGVRGSLVPGGQRAAALESLRLRVLDLTAGRVEWRLAGRAEAMRDLALVADRRLAQADDRLNRLDIATSIIQGLASTLLVAGALLLGATLVAGAAITPPVAALLLLVSTGMMEPVAALRRGAVELGRSLRAASRVAADLRPLPAPATPAHPADGVALRLEAVRFRHEGAVTALFDGLSLTVEVGQHVAILGESGAGKSSLLALLTGEQRAEAGNITALPWTLLGQETALFQDDLRANLALAAPDADDARLTQALADAGLADVVAALPAGLDSLLGEGGSGLSSGQRRRLALARFLLRDRPLWLLDEPTDGLDLPTARDVLARLKQRADGRTLLVVTHLRREATLADRLIRLESGRISLDVRRGDAGFEEALGALRGD